MWVLSIGIVVPLLGSPLLQKDSGILDSCEKFFRLNGGNLGAEAKFENKEWTWVDEEDGAEVMSRVIVGSKCEEEIGNKAWLALDWSKRLKFIPLKSGGDFARDAKLWSIGWDVEEPDNKKETAAEVVDAMAVAESGSVWLWVPSYVVIKMVISSAHLCTYDHAFSFEYSNFDEYLNQLHFYI